MKDYFNGVIRMKSREKRLFKELMNVSEAIALDGSLVMDKRSWRSLEVSHYGTRWQENGMLFTGNAGVGLFFNELYAFTGDRRFVEISRQAMNWVEDYLTTCKVNHPAFYIGNSGPAYVFLRLFETTRHERYRDLALSLLRGKSNQVSGKDLHADLLSGHAGIIPCLIYAHALTGEPDLLDRLTVHVFHLLDAALVDHAGLKWGYKEKNINSLCGLSHGASGVGYAFVLLARYFGNGAFLYMAGRAFDFERQYYCPGHNNWLDLRLLESPENALLAFRNNDLSYFYRGSDSNSWSHGAAGIGLVRLRGYEVSRDPLWLKEALLAIEKCIATDISGHPERSFSLSAGKAGVAELFLEAYRILGEEKYLDYALRIAEEAVAWRVEKQQYPVGLKDSMYDNGLFMGRTGFAYLLLRVLNKHGAESVLLPGLHGATSTHGQVKRHLLARLTKEQLQKHIYKKYVQQPVLHAGGETPSPDHHVFTELVNACDRPALFEQLHDVSERRKALVITQAKLTLLRENRSYIYSATRGRISEMQAMELSVLDAPRYSQLRLQFNPAVAVVCVHDGPSGAARSQAILLKRKGNTVTGFELNLLSEIIFRHTYAGITVHALIVKVTNQFGTDAVTEQPTGYNQIMLQVRNLVGAGFLEANP